jgi:hypothetical protein
VKPTPSGVPVAMMSPGCSVMIREMEAISSGILNTIMDVFESCRTSLPIRSEIRRACGSTTSSRVTSQGPMGAKPSKPLPASHCEVRIWKSRALTSWKQV